MSYSGEVEAQCLPSWSMPGMEVDWGQPVKRERPLGWEQWEGSGSRSGLLGAGTGSGSRSPGFQSTTGSSHRGGSSPSIGSMTTAGRRKSI